MVFFSQLELVLLSKAFMNAVNDLGPTDAAQHLLNEEYPDPSNVLLILETAMKATTYLKEQAETG